MSDIKFKKLSSPDCFDDLTDYYRACHQAMLDSIAELAIPEHLLRGNAGTFSGRHCTRPTVPTADCTDGKEDDDQQ